MPSDTPTIDYRGTNSPQAWQSLLSSAIKGFGDVAIAKINQNDNRQAQVQQAPVSASTVNQWLPWIIVGGVAIAIVAVIAKK